MKSEEGEGEVGGEDLTLKVVWMYSSTDPATITPSSRPHTLSLDTQESYVLFFALISHHEGSITPYMDTRD